MTPHISPPPSRTSGRPARTIAPIGTSPVDADPRWGEILTALTRLREQRRSALRIVDADCGSGLLLLHALSCARTLGFTAIEGRGIDGMPALIDRARTAARILCDPAIGIGFDLADAATALEDEFDFPADIVLWKGPCTSRVAAALARAGHHIICDEPSLRCRRAEA